MARLTVVVSVQFDNDLGIAGEYTKRQWTLPTLEPIYKPTDDEDDYNDDHDHNHHTSTRMSLPAVFPYWLSGEDAVTNDVDLNGQWLVSDGRRRMVVGGGGYHWLLVKLNDCFSVCVCCYGCTGCTGLLVWFFWLFCVS